MVYTVAAPLTPRVARLALTCSLLEPNFVPLLQAKSGSGLVEGYSSVDDLVEQADGFAEVFPEHKFEIVKMLQVSH